MDILGIGFPELLLILIIAMMIFGPRRLPEIAAKLGKFVSDLRNMSSGLMTEWQREIAVATRMDELEKTRQEFNDIKEEIQQTRKNLAGEASSSIKELDQAREEVAKEVKSLPESASANKAAKTSSPLEETDETLAPSTEEAAAPEVADPVAQREFDRDSGEVEKEVNSPSGSTSPDGRAKPPPPLEKTDESTQANEPEEADDSRVAPSPTPPRNESQSSTTQTQPVSPPTHSAEAVNE